LYVFLLNGFLLSYHLCTNFFYKTYAQCALCMYFIMFTWIFARTRRHLKRFLFVVTSENPKDFSAKYILYYSVQDKGDRSGGACNGSNRVAEGVGFNPGNGNWPTRWKIRYGKTWGVCMYIYIYSWAIGFGV